MGFCPLIFYLHEYNAFRLGAKLDYGCKRTIKFIRIYLIANSKYIIMYSKMVIASVPAINSTTSSTTKEESDHRRDVEVSQLLKKLAQLEKELDTRTEELDTMTKRALEAVSVVKVWRQMLSRKTSRWA